MFGWLTNPWPSHDKCDLSYQEVEIMSSYIGYDNTGSTVAIKTDNGIIPVREDSSGSEVSI